MKKGAYQGIDDTEKKINKLSMLLHNKIIRFCILLEIGGLAECCLDFFLFGRLSVLTSMIIVWVLVLPPFLYVYVRREWKKP